MIKVFSGNWRGIGLDGEQKKLGILLDFGFREILHNFSGAKLAVFMAIVLHSNQDGLSWPSYSLLERETGYARDTIARAISDLCKLQIQGERVLCKYRERDDSGRYRGSNRYLVFPNKEELILFEEIEEPEQEPELENPTTPELENPTRGSPKIQLGGSPKIGLEVKPLINNNQQEEKSTNGENPPFVSSEKPDLVDAALKFAKINRIDVGEYPEETQGVIEAFCRLWALDPPSKKDKSYTDWLASAKTINAIAGDLAVATLQSLAEDPYSWMKEGGLVSRPGALEKSVRARVGRLRGLELDGLIDDWTPEQLKATEERLLKALEERSAENV